MSEIPRQPDFGIEAGMRAMRRASADAIERARIFGTTLIYSDKDGNSLEVDPNDLLRENPNLIRELMGNDDPPIGHWGPLPLNQQSPRVRRG